MDSLGIVSAVVGTNIILIFMVQPLLREILEELRKLNKREEE